MMSGSDRVKLLMIIWGSFAVAAGWSFSGDPRNFSDVILGFIYAASAVVGTALVLRYGIEEATSSRKSKRGDNDVNRAIDSMDDEELLMLRRRLMIDTENSTPLQDLMPREQKQAQ